MSAPVDLAVDFRVMNAIAYIADPHACVAEANAEWAAAGVSTMDDPYPYMAGFARSLIGSLLDVIGARDHGPTRFDCEWAIAHPYEDEDDR